jgi:predicted HicB family RNase H-like nuclease
MNYRGYTARYELDAHDQVLHGRVDGIRDIVTFVATNVVELEHEFHVSVDEYLSYCAEKGLRPEKPQGERRRTISQVHPRPLTS